MIKHKIEFRFFTVPGWKKEERYLSERHKNGWVQRIEQLESIG